MCDDDDDDVVSLDATVQIPAFAPTDPIKADMYRLRGEAMAVSASIDYIVRRLSDEFAGVADPQVPTARRWTALKEYIAQRGLTNQLQREMEAIAIHLRTRQLPAHGMTILTQVGESTQIFRLYHDGAAHKVESTTFTKLEQEVAATRAGYAAIQAVGCALDDDQPGVLADWNTILRAMILGRT